MTDMDNNMYHEPDDAMDEVSGDDVDEASLRSREAERKHFESVLQSFYHYKDHGLIIIEKHESSYQRLPIAHQQILSHLPSKFETQKKCLQANQEFLERIMADCTSAFIHNSPLLHGARTHFENISGSGLDMDKIRCTLRQFVRDWSKEGKEERKQCYEPITEALVKYFADYDEEDRYLVRVLVPGAGLGRLTYDIAKLGFSAQGCEFSYQMLIASNYILNYSPAEEAHEIYPWVLTSSNVWDADKQQLKQIRVPDEIPGGLGPNVDFSMVAGDFLDVYKHQQGQWNCVVTCFFIDTASNIVQYVEHIHSLLPPGGVWINLGPLLYHYTNSPDVDSTELSYAELREVIAHYGFELRDEERRTCSYTQNMGSMMQTIYECPFFVAIHKSKGTAGAQGAEGAEDNHTTGVGAR